MRTERHVRFKNRVALEREVLSIANSSLRGSEGLKALTPEAIERWSARCRLPEANFLVRLLHEISARLRIQADNSCEVFTDGELLAGSATDRLIDQLRLECTKH